MLSLGFGKLTQKRRSVFVNALFNTYSKVCSEKKFTPDIIFWIRDNLVNKNDFIGYNN